MTKNFKIIFSVHRINGDSPPPSLILMHLIHKIIPQFCFIYSFFSEQPTDEKFDLEKSIEVMLESQQQIQNLLDSQSS